MNLRAPNILRTPRLVGRRVAAQDLVYLRAVDADPEVQRTLSGTAQTYEQSRARLERWLGMWETYGIGFWIFRDAAGDDLGHAGLFPSPADCANIEVGYALKPAYWGRGYATEMAGAALSIAFETLLLPRVIAMTAPDNLPSMRVMEKLGLQFERNDIDDPRGASVRYAIERARWLVR